MTRIPRFGGQASVVLAALVVALMPAAAHAAKESVLYSFQGGVKDGAFTQAGVVKDAHGNFFGTTQAGGGTGCGGSGCGTVFKLTPQGRETLLHIFTASGSDGTLPVSGLAIDTSGNLYGTTFFGGKNGVGTVFKVTPAGNETVLHSFGSGNDGSRPVSDLISDPTGTLYGMATSGGTFGHGTIFKITPSGTETTLYSFAGGADGAAPVGSLVRDSAGNFYGATGNGGIDCDGSAQGCGTIFKLASTGRETVLSRFTGGNFGSYPAAGVVMDASGAFYGTTNNGGMDCDGAGVGCGLAYKVSRQGVETVLHTFFGGVDGAYPKARFTMDSAGNFYGTTSAGGVSSRGTVFRLTPRGREKILYAFTGGSDGNSPFSGLIMDSKGDLIGTTFVGGLFGDGTVFKVKNR